MHELDARKRIFGMNSFRFVYNLTPVQAIQANPKTLDKDTILKHDDQLKYLHHIDKDMKLIQDNIDNLKTVENTTPFTFFLRGMEVDHYEQKDFEVNKYYDQKE